MRLLCTVLLTALIGCVNPDAPVRPGDDAPFDVEIPKGANAATLGRLLVTHEMISSETTWKVALKTTDLDPSCLKAGKFRLTHAMSLREVITTVCGTPIADEVAFTVIEGWRIRDIDAALVAAGLSQPGVYAEVATNKTVPAPFEVKLATYEGLLYPETYMVPREGVDPKKLVARQLATFQERFLVQHPDGFGKRSLEDIVIMASMLEREEPKPVQRPLVAGILWKRIDSGWQLGVDATSRYTLDEWNDRKAFLKQLRDPGDPYNTRIHKGLPPTAIGNPTLSSLQAATAPVASDFWYYLHDGAGTLHPAKDANGHEANRKRYNVY